MKRIACAKLTLEYDYHDVSWFQERGVDFDYWGEVITLTCYGNDVCFTPPEWTDRPPVPMRSLTDDEFSPRIRALKSQLLTIPGIENVWFAPQEITISCLPVGRQRISYIAAEMVVSAFQLTPYGTSS